MRIRRLIALNAAAAAGVFASAAIAVSGQAEQPGSRAPQTIVVEGRREPGEASVSTRAMKYLPFDVPPGVTGITIHRDYDHGPDPTRKNTVDFGLFDTRGPQNGFRGWQGGSPGDFVITGDPLTGSPHAIPGPLTPGRWYLAQYFLVSSPTGLGYKYTITFNVDGPKPPAAIPAPPTYAPGVLRQGAAWYAGNLHVHSLHSDGRRTFPELIGHCANAGFDFVVSTEHNSPTAHYRFPDASLAHPKTLLLYGNEFTSPGGHACITGMRPGSWFDFRIDPGDNKLPGVIADAHRQGALFTVNHPFALCTSCLWRYPAAEWSTADAIEVWNGKWTPDDRAAINLWDRQLKAGHRIWAFGGTDYHRGDDPLSPAALVYAGELSTPAILDGMRQGHVTLSESPKGPRVTLQFPDIETRARPLPGDTLHAGEKTDSVEVMATVEAAAAVSGAKESIRLVWSDGEARLPLEGNATARQRIPLTKSTTYVRAELLRVDEEGGETMVSLTNPIFVTR